MRLLFTILFFISTTCLVKAQYVFDGSINSDTWQNGIYLSIVDDYRTMKSINDEQVISKVPTDAHGNFIFKGNQLNKEQRIYKLHVDNCDSKSQDLNHFKGHCPDSKSILFIAKNTDSITFPLSFDAQMFCKISSTNPKALAFVKVDSLKEEMKFEYTEFKSKASRDLNNKKWFKVFQELGISLNEPLAELYIYEFLSDRNKPFHNYYLKDVKQNNYYHDLLNRLKAKYPNSNYALQYEADLSSLQFEQELTKKEFTFNYIYLLIPLLLLSLGFNYWFFKKIKHTKNKQVLDSKLQLTKQEQNVLDLILADNSNKAIAESLFVSLSTIKTHINNIYKKLNVSSRDELKELYNK